MARELIILPRFKRDFRYARKHPEFEPETLEHVLDLMISGSAPPEAFRKHRKVIDRLAADQRCAFPEMTGISTRSRSVA